jgi:uncharacterized protein DUF3455
MEHTNRKAFVFFCASFVALFAIAIARLAAQTPAVPANLKPPDGESQIAEAHAKGFQVYSCKEDVGGYEWTLKGPDAELFDKAGKKIGRHFAGPTWESSDHSQVTGKLAASVPSPDADSIPWLLVNAVGHSGDGLLAKVLHIQRLNTKGGKAPATGCDEKHGGQESRVAYTADYVFFGK